MLERSSSLRSLRWVVVVAPLLIGCGSAATTRPKAPVTSSSPAAAPAAVDQEERGIASYYSDRLAGRPTASGQPYEPTELTAAHRTLPFGAVVRVTRTSNGRSVEVRINDRGPHTRGRIVDLSRRAADALGLVRDGVAEVALRVLSLPPPKKKRKR